MAIASSVTVDLRGKTTGTFKLKVQHDAPPGDGQHRTITSSRAFTFRICL
jgi:hypothetical protein